VRIVAFGSSTTKAFATAVPQPANLPTIDVSGLISAYGFSEGVIMYAHGDPSDHIGAFQVQTDAAGVPAMQQVHLQRWQAARPQNAGNARLDLLFFTPAAAAATNITCTAFGTSPPATRMPAPGSGGRRIPRMRSRC
jgi:hypothetical protein